MLEVAEVDGTDTTWTAYSRTSPWLDHMELSMSMVVHPILSSASLDFWDGVAVSVTGGDGDTVYIEAAGATNTFVYRVDTTRWVITELTVIGDPYYNATYRWAESNGVYVLTRASINDDPDIQQGGFEFATVTADGNTIGAIRPRALVGMRGARSPATGGFALTVGTRPSQGAYTLRGQRLLAPAAVGSVPVVRIREGAPAARTR